MQVRPFRLAAQCLIGVLSVLTISVAGATAIVNPLTNTSSASALTLVNSLLAAQSNLTLVAGSAQYIGQASASGTFTNGGTGSTGLGIDRGVVLTSGDARFVQSSAAFPGDSANKTGDFTSGFGNTLTVNNAPGNALLNGLTSAGTANASILSFQFIPDATSFFVSLQFVFGSEDYNDLVNAGFPTDVFGIFVNGVNWARVPGTGSAVSAATINCGGPTSSAAPNVGGQNCGLYRDNPPFFDNIDSELDGLTTLLTLRAPIIPGQINLIQIGIADAFDTVGDSAVLLRSASFAAVPEPASVALVLVGLAAAGRRMRRRPS